MIEPVYLLESVPPKVSSPFSELSEVVGAKETETTFDEIVPYVVVELVPSASSQGVLEILKVNHTWE